MVLVMEGITNISLVNKMFNARVDGDLVYIQGRIDHAFKNALLFAAEPIDRRSSYYGSGLPFPSTTAAFSTMTNTYKIETNDFQAILRYPNAFYMANGRDRIPPTVYLIVDDKIVFEYKLPDRLMLKSLNYRYRVHDIPREYFFGYKDAKLPVANAEEVMRTYAQYKTEFNIA